MSRNVTLCCDKCGGTREFRPGVPPDPVRIQVSRGDPPKVKPEREYDLCESCLGLFIIWVSQLP
jgi:hypothetical protein